MRRIWRRRRHDARYLTVVVLRRCGGNVSRAARALGLSDPSSLRDRIRVLGLRNVLESIRQEDTAA